MEAEFWLQRWRENKIGFHLDDANPHLRVYWDRLAVSPPARVFVPLCGKSFDMFWLRQHGYQVVGVEISPLAVEALFAEQGVVAEKENINNQVRWQANGITVWCGDYFQLTAGQLGRIDAVYDRAALIALPEQMRADYVSHMKTLVGVVPQLLITLSYDQATMEGPPFSVDNAEIRRLYGQDYQGAEQPVASHDILTDEGRFRERGVTSLFENVYVLQVPKK